MEPNKKPVLSIGMIFKNEIRCLERCMKALQPLRDAIPCELVMADTGSDDGSREIAEQYADIFFDFPWINDFAAARNAVMDRCSGQWFFSIDADEWLDEDMSGLIQFLTGKNSRKYNVAGLTVRNYSNKSLSQYSDMIGVRMVRMETGIRYTGEIHESFQIGKKPETVFGIKAILHHDGYVGDGGPWGRDKLERNMTLLEQQFERKPQDLRVLMECVESARDDGERERYLRLAVEGIKQKYEKWDVYGPPILRYDVLSALNRRLPDMGERAKQYRDWFPNSPFIDIDVSYMMVRMLSNEDKFSALIPWGERYMQKIAEYRAGSKEMAYALLFGVLMMISPLNEREVRILLTDAYFHQQQYEKCKEMLLELDVRELNGELLRNYVGILMNLQSQSGLDLSGHMAELWEKITAPDAPEKRAQEHQQAVVAAAGHVFQQSWRTMEDKNNYRHAYTLFLPLEGKCETGLAAAILEEKDASRLEEKICAVKEWKKFPIHALAYALKNGAQFPLPDQNLKLEEMDWLANRMSKIGDGFVTLAIASASQTESHLQLCWARGLLLAAMSVVAEQLQKTKTVRQAAEEVGGEVEDIPGIKEQNMELFRAFAEVERKFLPLCYAPAALSEEGLFLLPPLHRFGWYCTRAFEALDGGDPAGYVRALRAGLTSCESMKPVVEFLTDHTPELQQPSQELLELAEKVRTLLSAYDPADPAVAALKQSPAYQKVAHLIEGSEVPVVGGLVQ